MSLSAASSATTSPPLAPVPSRRLRSVRSTSRFVDPNALAPRLAPRLRTERLRRLERAASRRLEQRSQDRAALIASISHELLTPLTSVVGYSEVLLSGDTGDLAAEQRAMLERVASNGDRLLELIEGLLCAARERLEHGGAIDVADVVLQVVGEPEGRSGRWPA